ncbi:hypothetical protein ACLKMH_20105 [Psychromonas sp. KJ10-10]
MRGGTSKGLFFNNQDLPKKHRFLVCFVIKYY